MIAEYRGRSKTSTSTMTRKDSKLISSIEQNFE